MIAAMVLSAALSSAPGPAAAPAVPWRARGDAIQAEYAAHGQRLRGFYDALTARLSAHAPELLPLLRTAAPAPVPHGYQVLPELLPPPTPPPRPPRAEVRVFSWPKTRAMIEREEAKLVALEAELARGATVPREARTSLYGKLVADYVPRPKAQESIEIQIQYNRLWQNSIAANRAGYDRETRLEKAVVERQAIRDALAASDDAALRTREATLSREIHDATGHLSPPPFLRIERVSRGRVVVHVPVYTDIQDKKFLRAFESAVEGIWHVTDGDDDFRVELEFKRESPRRLYAPTGAAPPKAGDPIDEQKHCDLFPGGAAILTTGASTGHVRGMRCMVMGAYAISPHDLAHEFGHVLGFKDVYFRGYEDLGADGFEVHEVIAESDDIMGAPGSAPVTKRQFTRLIEALARSEDD